VRLKLETADEHRLRCVIVRYSAQVQQRMGVERAVNLLNETIELEPNYMPTHFLLVLVRIQEKCLAEDLFRRVGFLS
jgi:hypothetical protein